MALTVNAAFAEFNKNIVNLNPNTTKTARASRDWLIKQLEGLADKVENFPRLYNGKHIKFGSFARNTKIKPLDDIDLILTFSAEGSTYYTHSYGKKYTIFVPESATKLHKLCDDNGILNSIKLINKLVNSLDKIEHYKSAEKHRRQEAATLQLVSYEWNFDIVPAFYTDTGYYLIPDGNGNWKATDPRIDQERVSNINQKHNGKVLQLIRTLKYWNNRVSMPTIPSYLFENIVLNFAEQLNELSGYIDFNLRDFWYYLKDAIYNEVQDPKGFQGNLNVLSFDDQIKISLKANDTYTKALEAIHFETQENNQKKAINKWREIFGNEFPTYG